MTNTARVQHSAQALPSPSSFRPHLGEGRQIYKDYEYGCPFDASKFQGRGDEQSEREATWGDGNVFFPRWRRSTPAVAGTVASARSWRIYTCTYTQHTATMQ